LEYAILRMADWVGGSQRNWKVWDIKLKSQSKVVTLFVIFKLISTIFSNFWLITLEIRFFDYRDLKTRLPDGLKCQITALQNDFK